MSKVKELESYKRDIDSAWEEAMSIIEAMEEEIDKLNDKIYELEHRETEL